MYNLYVYSPMKSIIVGFEKNELMERCFGDWSSIQRTMPTISISDMSSVQHVQRIKSMGFIGDWTYTQRTKAIILMGDGLMPIYVYQ